VKKQLTILTLTLAFILIFSGTVSAAEWTVGPDGTYNYQSIQGAVDGSGENDTITVSPNGTSAYTENVVVNKTGLLIRAIGTVTVQPQDQLKPVFYIDSNGNNSTIQGFIIRSGGYDNSYYGIGLVQTSGCRITNNDILNANQAIYADRCSDITIDGNTITNTITNNNGLGIYVYNSPGISNNKALNNILTGNRGGIEWSRTNYGEISGNTIQNSELNGILLIYSAYNVISSNTITGTQIVSGDWFGNGDGIFLSASSGNTISLNTLANNANDGIHLRYASDYNIINANTISSSSNGIYLEKISVYGNSYNTIQENTIQNNVIGISLVGSDYNTIQRNDVNNNVNGINLYGSGSNTISENNASDNSNVGIFVQENSIGNNVINNIANGNVHGIYLDRFCDYNTIEGNTVDQNDETGITIGASALNTIKNNIISNNGFISGTQRCGIWSNYYGNTITGNTIINNFNGIGLGNYLSNGLSETINYNRILNNNNWNLYNTNSNGMPDATYNWWGCNLLGEVSSKISGTGITYDPWMILTITADQTLLGIGDTTNVIVDLTHDNNNLLVTTGQIPDGALTSFAFSLGTMNPLNTALSGNSAISLLTAGLVSGTSSAQATVDGYTVGIPITIDATAPTVTADFTTGKYNMPLIVTLTTTDPDSTATTYYTTDSTDPQTSPTRLEYTDPITISSTTTLRFSAVDPAGNWSPNYTETYTRTQSSLYLNITMNKNNSTAGEEIIIRFKVGNNGSDAAENVVMTYVIPEGLEFVGATDDTGNTWTYDENTRTVTWNLGTVPQGDPNLWLTLRVAQAGQYLINPALSTSTYDPTLESSIQSIIVNAAVAQTNDDETTGTTVNAQTTTETVGMQETGLPIPLMVFAILMILGGLIEVKRD